MSLEDPNQKLLCLKSIWYDFERKMSSKNYFTIFASIYSFSSPFGLAVFICHIIIRIGLTES